MQNSSENARNLFDDSEIKYRARRSRLVETLRERGIRDEGVLAAIGKVPRHRFVADALRHEAYQDRALPIGSDQTISQPYTVAYQSSLIQPEPRMKVLEIGTGSGYQTAVLCEMGLRVFSVERIAELSRAAGRQLEELGYAPRLRVGDGTAGWPQFRPFQAIIVTAGSPEVPQPLLEQLDIGGRLVLPVGDRKRQRMRVIHRRSETDFKTQEWDHFVFVPLLGRFGWEEEGNKG